MPIRAPGTRIFHTIKKYTDPIGTGATGARGGKPAAARTAQPMRAIRTAQYQPLRCSHAGRGVDVRQIALQRVRAGAKAKAGQPLRSNLESVISNIEIDAPVREAVEQ